VLEKEGGVAERESRGKKNVEKLLEDYPKKRCKGSGGGKKSTLSS